VEIGKLSIREAIASEHPIALCLALKWGGAAVSLKVGDLNAAERAIEALIDHAHAHSLGVDWACGLGLQGQLALRKGEAEAIHLLRTAVDAISKTRLRLLHAGFLLDLADALARSGDVLGGLTTTEDANATAERIGERWLVPEILRVKAELLLQQDRSNSAKAERIYLRSLEMARDQGALSWELRAAMSLGQVYYGNGRIREACDLLSSVYSRFTEGFGTADLRQARQLLDEWAAGAAPRRSA
jgi:predicted ATPase